MQKYYTGAGFSGFWYHLGFLHARRNAAADLDDENDGSTKDYYCFSSGCLSLVLSEYSVDDVWDAAVAIQDEWLSGHLSRYDLVEHFVRPLLSGKSVDEKIRILVTDRRNGVRVEQATNDTDHLIRLLVQTTHIPMATGPWPASSSNFVVDGGFSRWLHPVCAETVYVPTTIETTLHSLNPALDKATALSLYDQGLKDASKHHPTAGAAARKNKTSTSSLHKQSPSVERRNEGVHYAMLSSTVS